MDPQSQNDSSMSYGHMPLSERRDTLDSNGSTPYQSHQSLGQALGSHLAPSNLSGSNSHSPLTFSVPPPAQSPAMKRKQIDPSLGGGVPKRRREGDDGDVFDTEGGQGAKHWTDEEKSKLFTWLMGQGQDDHWNSLRATKNSCLRDCAVDVFGSKKTYQALKGCYERNFNLFKQIYAFETFHANMGTPMMSALSEADRLREYERRLQSARKAGCDVGNITARAIDHWHRIGWYDLFYRRWHGDPATTRPVIPRTSGPNVSGGNDDDDDDHGMDSFDPSIMVNGLEGITPDRGHSVSYLNPQNMPMSQSPPTASGSGSNNNNSNGNGNMPLKPPVSSDIPLVNFSLTQSMMSAYMQYLQTQTHNSKIKLDYLRRREEREEKDSTQRREIERLRLERETAEFEHGKQAANVKQKADRAIELLGNPAVDASVKQAASDYLKKLFEQP